MGPRVVVMGVSGSGKSTVGERLARRLGLDFADADSFHSPANMTKMAAGMPLTDEDRRPWLEAIARWLAEHAEAGGVVTSSALKRSYRDLLRDGAPDAWFLHLVGSRELMERRVADRDDHFMPASLVPSQFAALEAPTDDERVVTVDADQSPDNIVDEFVSAIDDATSGEAR
jgi:gluconokinase